MKLLLLILLFAAHLHAITFDGRSKLYEWINNGNDPITVHELILKDGMNYPKPIAGELFLDDDIEYVCNLFSNLEKIEFQFNFQLSDEAFTHLHKLDKLKQVYLYYMSCLTERGVYLLGQAQPNLETLILYGNYPNLHPDLSPFTNLKALSFCKKRMMDWSSIQLLSSLRRLEVKFIAPWESNLENLYLNLLQNPNIKELYLDFHDNDYYPNSSELNALLNLKHLQKLSITFNLRVSFVNFSHYAQLEQAIKKGLAHTDVHFQLDTWTPDFC